ncbi:MAG: hypothetical protein ACUVQP_06620 [Bacteroidales bacterium]
MKLLPMYNETMEKLFSVERFSKSEIGENKLKVVEFSNKYGVKATQDAFNV